MYIVKLYTIIHETIMLLYIIMSCLAPGYNPNPTRTWSRVQSNCSLVIPTTPITQAEVIELQMRRKGNVLQYKENSSNLTKTQQYSLIAQGKWTNRRKLGKFRQI